MPNPVIVQCPADTWTLIGSDVRGTLLHRIGSQATNYVWTYREVGDDPPTTADEGKSLFDKDDNFELPKSKGFDFYVYPHKKAGSVRLDEYEETIDVFIQDQTTAFDDFFFIQQIGSPTTLTADTVFDSYTVDVASIADISIGDTIFIFSGVTGEERFFRGIVLGIAVLTLTLDRQMDFVFDSGDTVISTTEDLNVDGSVTPQVFEIRAGGPTSTLEFDITRILMENLSASAVDLSTFGDIAGGLTRGLQLREKITATTFKNKWNIKQNKDFALLGYDWEAFAATNPAQGQDGFKWRYSLAGPSKHGVVKRIGSNSSLQLIVQDSLLTLISLTAIGGNHEVD